jgi:hypothetical protein
MLCSHEAVPGRNMYTNRKKCLFHDYFHIQLSIFGMKTGVNISQNISKIRKYNIYQDTLERASSIESCLL